MFSYTRLDDIDVLAGLIWPGFHGAHVFRCRETEATPISSQEPDAALQRAVGCLEIDKRIKKLFENCKIVFLGRSLAKEHSTVSTRAKNIIADLYL